MVRTFGMGGAAGVLIGQAAVSFITSEKNANSQIATAWNGFDTNERLSNKSADNTKTPL